MAKSKASQPKSPVEPPKKGGTPPKPKSHDPMFIADICEQVYRQRMDRGDMDADRAIAEKGRDKFRKNAMCYAIIVGATLNALETLKYKVVQEA